MTKVIMKTLAAGPGGVVSPGESATVSDDHAEDLVRGGFAQYETATVEAPEKREAEDPIDFSKMPKKVLLAHAQQRGIEVPKKATNKQIRALLG